jgi:hypothetical protein
LQKEKLEKDAYFELLNSIKQRVLDGKLSLSQKTVDKLEAGLVAISSSHANPRFIVDDFVFSM